MSTLIDARVVSGNGKFGCEITATESGGAVTKIETGLVFDTQAEAVECLSAKMKEILIKVEGPVELVTQPEGTMQ